MSDHPDITDLMRTAATTDGAVYLRSDTWNALADLVEVARRYLEAETEQERDITHRRIIWAAARLNAAAAS